LLSTFTTTVRTEVDIPLDPAAYRDALARFEAEHAPLRDALVHFEKEQLPSRLDRWLAQRGKAPAKTPWLQLGFVEKRSQGGASFTSLDDGSLLIGGKNPNTEMLTLVAHTQARGIRAIRLEALAHPSLVKGGPGRASNGNFALSEFRVTAAPLKGKGEARLINLINARATYEQKGLPIKAAIDGDKKSAWAVDPQFGKDHAAVFETETEIGFEGGTILTFTLEFHNNTGHGIGRPRLSVSTEASAPVTGDSLPDAVQILLTRLSDRPEEQLSSVERETLVRWYRTTDPEWRKLNQRVQDHQAKAPKATASKALVCSEGLPPVRLHSQGADFLTETHFLKRGDPNQKDGVADQGFLQVLMRTGEQEKHWKASPPSGWRTSYRRKALADWITDVDHGAGQLLARVIVNRLWQHHMGRGLVGTPGDFGFQGERPTHPELLDWLAGELIARGWSLKAIHKLILTSSAYRQESAGDRAKASMDPENRLYWRRTPRRLEAEVIRDAMLAVGNLLDDRMFGPGTLDSNHRRRSIYFFVKRSQLPAMITLFDGPDTLQGMEARATTTIAPQALLLMNNKLVRDCAEGIARRVAPADGRDLTAAVQQAYLVALARRPTAEEGKDALAFLKEQQDSYQADRRKDALHLALTDFCQVLLELNEFVYID
jgi:hypothetical protein